MLLSSEDQKRFPRSRDLLGGAPLFARIAAHVAVYVEIFGAARRLAVAAETRRRPDPADLKILGVTGSLPRTGRIRRL
jgi:hypothetical protein